MTEAIASAAPAATPVAQGQSTKPAQAASQPAGSDASAGKYRVKVDGKEIEVSTDELLRGYSHAAAANKRLAEAAQERKKSTELAQRANQVLSRLESGDVGFLVEKLGPQKARQAFEDFLLAQMEYDQLPDSEKRARELEKKLRAIEDEKKKSAEEHEQREYQRTLEQAQADIDRDVGDALQKLGKKPTPRLVIRVIDEMMAHMGVKDSPLPADKAVEMARQGIYADIAEYVSDMSPEEAFKVLPKPFLDRLRQHEVTKVLGDKQQRRVKAQGSSSSEEVKPLSTDDWFAKRAKELQKRKRG
jgi:hypothetical protein